MAVVVGGVIGSAIFLVPSSIFQTHPSPLAALIVFLLAGALSYFGALAYAELGSMLSATGGEYVFLRESWGPLWGFLCGWSYLVVTQTGGIAAMAVGFAALVASLLPMSAFATKLWACGLLVVLTVLNILGVRTGAWTGNVLTAIKVGGLGAMIAGIFVWAPPAPIDWSWPRDWTAAQFGTALIPVLWAYEGWNLVTFIAGEVREPRRNIPRALASGLGIVVVVYALSLWVYLKALPVPEIAASQAVAPEAAMRIMGPVGGTLVTLTMIVALVGAANASVLAAPRMFFAQARDGLLFPSLGRLHPKFETPSRALVVQCIWAMILAASGTYDVLLSYCTFAAWVFYTMTVAGLILLRRRHPEWPRRFLMPGYPWTPIIFVLAGAAFVGSTIVSRPGPSLAGLALIASGVPFYLYWKRRSNYRV